VKYKVVNNKLLIPNISDLENDWNTIKIPIQMNRGANTIKLVALDDHAVLIDEIIIKYREL